MEYKFKKTSYSADNIKPIYHYGVEIIDDKILALEHIESWTWDSNKVQNILDEISVLEGEEGFDYQVEDGNLGISIYADEVYFFDLTSKNEDEEFIWSTEKFILFLNEFKAFLEENQ